MKWQQTLIDYLQQGATIITPNNRLALELQNHYLSQTPQRAVEKPCCLPYQTFIQHLYHLNSHQHPQVIHPLFISAQQTRWLWRQVIEDTLGQPAHLGLIQEIETAWRHCQLWHIDFSSPDFALTAQTRLLQNLALNMQNLLKEKHALTSEQIIPYLLQFNTLPEQEKIIWACFDDFTPQQRQLQAHMQSMGKQHVEVSSAGDAPNVAVYASQDDKDELEQLFFWLRAQLDQGKAPIGVVIPDLQHQAKGLHRQLQRKFAKSDYNLSLGLPLNEYPIVAHGLCWLTLKASPLSHQHAACLLRSPFLAHAQQEMLARAALLQESKSLLEPSPNPALFAAELTQKAPLLAQIYQQLTPYPSFASPSQWADLFLRRLIEVGFPGPLHLNSASYQCYQRFLALLDEFMQLQAITDEMAINEALSTLSEMAQTTIFQPKKPDNAPIHIMGLLEAAGSAFQSLWVTGLTDECLPQKTRLSAFIPKSLQIEYEMPHAHPDRELALAQKAISRLSQSAQSVVFSYAKMTQDKPNMPSPLLKPFTQAYQPLQSEQPIEKLRLVLEEESYLLPLQPAESPSGGTALIANQAKCPFRAFAAHRLHTRAAFTQSDGPNALERGNVVHQVMEKIWKHLDDQETLIKISQSELEHLVNEAIQTTLTPLVQVRPGSFSKLIQEVENQRLFRLVYAALEWEKQRPAFCVEGLEKSYTFHLAGLDIRVRVDRLDRLQDGSKWVIDYKTTIPPGTPWLEDRPTEPQLLLYTLLDEQISALLFAELKNGQLTIKGLSANSTEQQGIKALKKDQSWQACRETWEQQLQQLAQEFSSGHCPPDPAKPSICQTCDFGNLCRYSPENSEDL